jgi:hypothetical protein
MDIINEYSGQEYNYASSRLAKTYADCGEKLLNIYMEKFSYFDLSVTLNMVSLVIVFVFFVTAL